MPWNWLTIEIYDFNQYICFGKYHEMGLKLRYMTFSSIVTLQKKFSFMRRTFFEAYMFQIFRYTFSKCFFTKQDVLKNGKCHEIAKNSKYMTSIKIIALLKKFSFVSWSLFEAFYPKYIDILILRVFSPYRVS